MKRKSQKVRNFEAKQEKPQNLVAKHAKAFNRCTVHENKRRKKDLTYWHNQPKSSLADLI